MATYDREYMQNPDQRPSGPWAVTTRLVVLNVVVFLVVRASEAWFRFPLEDWLALDLDNLARGRVWTILTAAFVHGDGFHLLGNMLTLWFFGRFYETRRGPRGLVGAVLVLAVLAHLPHLVVCAVGSDFGTIGLSGVTTGLLLFAAFREPHMPVHVIFVTLPLWALAAILVAFDVLPALGLTAAPGVSYWVHLGGAVSGWMFHKFDWDPAIPDIAEWRARRKALAERRVAEKARAAEQDERDRVDALLEKVARGGLDSLTEAERDFLRDASKRYR